MSENSPTPTHAPDLAAIIAAAREFAKAERFGESCCWCPGTLRCKQALSGKACPSFLALIDAAAASRPAPPVADGEAKRLIVEVEQSLAKVKGPSLLSRYWPYILGIITDLSSRLSAAEARRAHLEDEIQLAWNTCGLAEEQASAAESACAALRERVGELERAIRKALFAYDGDPKHADAAITVISATLAPHVGMAAPNAISGPVSAALSASPVSQPAPATPECENPHCDGGMVDDSSHPTGQSPCRLCNNEPAPAPATAMPEAGRGWACRECIAVSGLTIGLYATKAKLESAHFSHPARPVFLEGEKECAASPAAPGGVMPECVKELCEHVVDDSDCHGKTQGWCNFVDKVKLHYATPTNAGEGA